MFPIQHCSELGDLVLRPDGDGLHHLLRAAAHPRVRGAVPLLGPGDGPGVHGVVAVEVSHGEAQLGGHAVGQV